MNTKLILTRQSQRLRLPLGFLLVLLVILAAAGLTRSGQASSTLPKASSGGVDSAQTFAAAAADTCGAATVIDPASLPFAEDSTLASAANDIDPGPAGCARGAGKDVVYSFTPAVTDTYTIGATPTTSVDLSLYIVTDCSNPAGTCVVGTNARGFDQGEFLTPVLTAGIRYFIVVDTPAFDGSSAAGFHFSLRRGIPANDTCGTATVIDPSRLPFSVSGTTFGATNDLDPGASCFTSSQSTNGADVVYQFTPADTQLYVITVTPSGRYDTSVYLITDCSAIAGCFGADVGGGGTPEIIRTTLNAGTTYFVVVDGFGGDAGDFAFSLQPSIPRAPVAPSELTASAVSATQINLTWRDNSGDELGFRVERSLDGFNFTEIATAGSNVTAFSDTNVFANTFFFYRVSAFNNFGTSDPSNIAFAQTPGNPIPANPVIVVEPASLDFGSVRVTQSDTRTITITNGGAANLIISSISDPGGPFTIVNRPVLPLTLQSTQSISLEVRFAPIFTGRANASFTIQSNDPNAPVSVVNLTGLGSSAPVANLEVTPGLIDFGTSTTPVTLELRNTGEADLLIATILLPSSPFAVSGTATGTLKSGERKTLTVTFSPATVGVFQSGISIVSNDPDSLITFILLKGTSTSQALVPRIVALEFRKRGLRFQAIGSNVVSGAVLVVDSKETFSLELSGDFWVVTKGARSTPGNLRVRDIFISPSTHSVVVRNPNGGTSTLANISV
ncbi:MAG: choice-of-anchor D domain-containing protein [Acidobacteriota bacterium]